MLIQHKQIILQISDHYLKDWLFYRQCTLKQGLLLFLSYGMTNRHIKVLNLISLSRFNSPWRVVRPTIAKNPRKSLRRVDFDPLWGVEIYICQNINKKWLTTLKCFYNSRFKIAKIFKTQTKCGIFIPSRSWTGKDFNF